MKTKTIVIAEVYCDKCRKMVPVAGLRFQKNAPYDDDLIEVSCMNHKLSNILFTYTVEGS